MPVRIIRNVLGRFWGGTRNANANEDDSDEGEEEELMDQGGVD